MATIDVMAQSIRDAIAPVFLLSGVATVLSVTTTRFSRIVDRYRMLMDINPQTETITAELVIMYRRSRIIHLAIKACTVCALLVCIVIGIMFVGTELDFSPTNIISVLFILAMITLITGLMLFLYEIHLASGTIETLGKIMPSGIKKHKSRT